VIVIGGGVVGCGTAWELAKAGLEVVVLERSVPGAEASSAAAGILGAQVEAHAGGPVFELALASRALYPDWARALARETGIDVEFRSSGVMRVVSETRALDRLFREHAFQRRHGCKVEKLSARAVSARVPALDGIAGGVAFPDDGRIDPPKLLRALRIAAERAGVAFRSGAYVQRVVVEDGRARGVELGDGSRLESGHVLVAAGSWSSLVEGVPLPSGGVVPARGQIVELTLPVPFTSWVVFGPGCYLVPRDDGRVLIGSTLEFVGFRREVTARGVRDLLDAALELAPALAEATLTGSWSSFRPFIADGLPALGATGIDRLWLATGHYRNGILLAPITAKIVRSLLLRRAPPLDLRPFSPER
jgi:glycine oxidase